MIRRDYILRMIEEYAQALAQIGSFKKGRRWEEAWAELDKEFSRLAGSDAQTVARLSETELLARLMQGEPTQVVRHKTLVLATLLNEAGDIAAARNRGEEAREAYLKSLHLLLDTLAREEVSDCPEFVPRVEMLVAALAKPLPPPTLALLMRHYERAGEFAKAEDALFALLDGDPDNQAIRDFGVAFYQRLLSHRDIVLNEGNLPRAEVKEGMAQLRSGQNNRAG